MGNVKVKNRSDTLTLFSSRCVKWKCKIVVAHSLLAGTFRLYYTPSFLAGTLQLRTHPSF